MKTENEIVDVPRIKYIEEHLRALKMAIIEGLNVKGYYAWSAIDLLSWLNGYKKQYGFIYVDHKNNLNRKIKLSGYWYKKIIEKEEKLSKISVLITKQCNGIIYYLLFIILI